MFGLFKESVKKAARISPPFFYALTIVLFGIASYFNLVYNNFLWDDRYLILSNPFIFEHNLIKIFTEDLTGSGFSRTLFYRPIQNISYIIDYRLWGFSSAGFHFTNITLHISCALLVFALIKNITKKETLSFLAALFFVTHPIHYAVVTYLSGRSDSLFVFFFLMSFILFIEFREKGARPCLYLSSGFFILALLSKEMAVIAPAVFILYDLIFRDRKKPLTPVIAVYPVYIIPILIYLALRLPHLCESVRASFPGYDIKSHLILFPYITCRYAASLLLPFNLYMQKGVETAPQIFSPPILASWAFVMLILILAFRLASKNKPISFFIFYFILSLTPVSNIFVKINAIFADHWLYMPSLGFFFVIAFLVDALFEKIVKSQVRDRRIFICGVFIAAFYAFLTIRQNEVWRDEITLFNRILKSNPRDTVTLCNIGMAYLDIGNFKKAVDLENQALNADASCARAYYNLGIIYYRMSDYKKAMDYFTKALGAGEGTDKPHLYIGLIHKQEGDYKKAEDEFRKFITISPYSALGYLNLGILKYEKNEMNDTEGLFKEAINRDPQNMTAYLYLAAVYRRKNDFKEALAVLEKANRIDPEDVNILMDLGNMYNSFGLYDRAISVFRKALIVLPMREDVYFNMGVSYQLKGDKTLAARYFKKALTLDPGFTEAANALESMKTLRGFCLDKASPI